MEVVETETDMLYTSVCLSYYQMETNLTILYTDGNDRKGYINMVYTSISLASTAIMAFSRLIGLSVKMVLD